MGRGGEDGNNIKGCSEVLTGSLEAEREKVRENLNIKETDDLHSERARER